MCKVLSPVPFPKDRAPSLSRRPVLTGVPVLHLRAGARPMDFDPYVAGNGADVLGGKSAVGFVKVLV